MSVEGDWILFTLQDTRKFLPSLLRMMDRSFLAQVKIVSILSYSRPNAVSKL